MNNDVKIIIYKYIHRCNLRCVLKELTDVTNGIKFYVESLLMSKFYNTFIYNCKSCRSYWSIGFYRFERYCYFCKLINK